MRKPVDHTINYSYRYVKTAPDEPLKVLRFSASSDGGFSVWLFEAGDRTPQLRNVRQVGDLW